MQWVGQAVCKCVCPWCGAAQGGCLVSWAGWDTPRCRRGLGGAVQPVCWGLWFWTASIANPVGEVWKQAGLRSTCTFPGRTLLNMQNYKNTQTTPILYVMWSNVHLQKRFLIFKVFCGCKFQCSFTLCFIIMKSERNYCQVGRYFLKPSFNICTYCNVLVRGVGQSVGSDQQEMCQKWHVFMTKNDLSGIKYYCGLAYQAWDNNFLICGSNWKYFKNYFYNCSSYSKTNHYFLLVLHWKSVSSCLSLFSIHCLLACSCNFKMPVLH